MKLTVISFGLMALVLTACGIKPGDVDPPDGRENSHFPHTYPAPGTFTPPLAVPQNTQPQDTTPPSAPQLQGASQ